MGPIHLNSGAARDFMAEQLVKDYGHEGARDKCCGEMLASVERVIAKSSIAYAPEPKPVQMVWHDGAPKFPWSSEWFIAETTHSDRVVLRDLPEAHTYDFKTADDTYIMRSKIKRWMQFSDSEFVPPDHVSVNTSDDHGNEISPPLKG